MSTAQEVRRWARKATEATVRRDNAIRQMRRDGSSLREVADAASLSHQAIAKIVARGVETPGCQVDDSAPPEPEQPANPTDG